MTHKLKCACCSNYLEIEIGPGQVSIDIVRPEDSFYKRVQYALGLIFKPGVYKSEGDLWITPKQWKKFLTQLNG
tara:strand:- start:11779 stop:12000 length:222 start_codon:yes stop_codon:yes gene_type:complete